jgi:very-short-patch-repair endonuclease
VDFVCHQARLIVEIDGDSHYSEDGMARDAVRTAFLEGEGYRLLRFSNLDVMESEEAVYLAVVEALEADGPTPPGVDR